MAESDTISCALHGAADGGDEAQVRELLTSGAPPDERNGNSEVPLHRACINGHAGVATALLEAGADAEACDGDGMRPLHLAAMGSHDAVVALLLASGASVDVPGRGGRLALHWAALYGGAGCCQLLVDVGADVGAVDASGKTAADLAERKGHGAVLGALQSANGAAGPADETIYQEAADEPSPLPRPLTRGFWSEDSARDTSPRRQPAARTEMPRDRMLEVVEEELEDIKDLLRLLVDKPADAAAPAPERVFSAGALAGVSSEGAAVIAVGVGVLGLALGYLCGIAAGRSSGG